MMHFHNNYHIITDILLMLIIINMIQFITMSPTNCSNKSRFERIYSRKKRLVVFPPGSAVLASVSLLKALIVTTPTGINLVNEAEFFYPLQTTIEEWYPKEVVEPVESAEQLDYDSNINTDSYQSTQHRKWSNYNQEDSKYWQQYAVHRNRRDILGQIERVAAENGFEIRSCLLRVICEANHYLLPPGQSFFQDVLRILFTTTHQDNVPDEYSHTMRATEDECANEYGSDCRYSILGFLLQNSK